MARKKKVKDENDVSLDYHLKHMNWCINNDIIIYFEPIDWRTGRIIVKNKGVKTKSDFIYNHAKLRVNDKRYHIDVYRTYTKLYKENHNGQI